MYDTIVEAVSGKPVLKNYIKNELSSNFIINTSKPKEHKFCMFHVKHYYYI